jgi:cell division protein FtsB
MTRQRLAVAAVAVLAMALAVFAGRNAVVLWQMQREIEAAERDVARLSAQQKKLEDFAERLRNDPASIEKVAREEMGMVREGETVLKFPSQPPPSNR